MDRPRGRSEGIPKLAVDLEHACDDGDEEQIRRLTDSLNAEVTDAVAAGDLAGVNRLASQVSRLIRRLGRSAGLADSSLTLNSLGLMLSTLDRARGTIAIRLNQTSNEREFKTVRERVLIHLAQGPARPLDVARALDVEPTQVSRALREFLDAKRVVVRRVVTVSGDRRARVYSLAEPNPPLTVDLTPIDMTPDVVCAIAVMDDKGRVALVPTTGRQPTQRLRRNFVKAVNSQLAMPGRHTS